jgi:hypothetical protein
MTWDEKYLVLLEKLTSDIYDASSGPYVRTLRAEDEDASFVIHYGPHKSLPITHTGLMRFWILRDGTVLKWSLGVNTWQEISSPRVKRALFMRAWPTWVPNCEPLQDDAPWYRRSNIVRRRLPLNRNSQTPCIRIIDP